MAADAPIAPAPVPRLRSSTARSQRAQTP
jgi:hypothetical protein